MNTPGIYVLTLFMFGAFVPAVPLTREEFGLINSFMYKLIKIGDLSSASLTIVKKSETVFKKGFGWANLAARRKADSDTVFCLSSMTETFSSALLSKLFAANNYTWDSTVQEILGDQFRLIDRYISDHVTLRDVMAHRTGVASMDVIVKHRAANSTDIVNRLMFAPKIQNFRYGYLHSRAMMSVIQLVTEKLGQNSWAELLTNYILQPLGMTRSSTYFVDQSQFLRLSALPDMKIMVDGIMKRTRVPADILRTLSSVPASGALCTSGSDIGKWISFHLEKGQMNGKCVLKEEWLEEMYKPQTPLDQSYNYLSNVQLGRKAIVFDTKDAAGLGWITGYYGMFKTLSSSGSWYGYESYLNLIPSRNLGFWLAFTGSSGRKAEAIKRLASLYLQDLMLRGNSSFPADQLTEMYNSIYQRVPFQSLARDNKPVTKSRALSTYIGVYGNAMFGYVNVSLPSPESDSLWLDYGDLKGGYYLIPTKVEDEFYIQARSGATTFYMPNFIEGSWEDVIIYFNVTETVKTDSEIQKEKDAVTTTPAVDEMKDGVSGVSTETATPTTEATTTITDNSETTTCNMTEAHKMEKDKIKIEVISVRIPFFDELAKPVFYKDLDIEKTLAEAEFDDCKGYGNRVKSSLILLIGVFVLSKII